MRAWIWRSRARLSVTQRAKVPKARSAIMIRPKTMYSPIALRNRFERKRTRREKITATRNTRRSRSTRRARRLWVQGKVATMSIQY